MDLSHVIAVVAGLVAGAIVALKVIAPRTKNKYDDKALEYLEKAESVIEALPAKK